MAHSTGVSLEAMHRVTAIASGVLDALPHSGAIITLLAVCKLSHGQSYTDILVAGIAAPLVSLIVVILSASLFGSFYYR